MKSWKKRWREELDDAIPTLRQDVKDASMLHVQKSERPSFKAWLKTHKTRFFTGLATCCAAVIAAVVALPYLLPPPTVERQAGAYFVEINPRAMFVVNDEGKIENVAAVNADADVILSSSVRVDNIIGKTPEEGIQVFVDYAAQLGYLDLDNHAAMRLSGCGNQEKLEKTTSALQKYFCKKGVLAAVVSENVSLQVFCERTGLPEYETKEELTQSISSFSILYTTRVADNSSGEVEWQETYREVTAKEIDRAIQAMIAEHLQAIAAHLGIPESMLEFIFGGYDSNEQFFDLFRAIGLDVSWIEELNTLPQTVEEYQQKLQGYFTSTFDDLQQKNAQAYGQVRDEIEIGAYEDYLQSIKNAYGSLAEYWQNLQEN